MDLNSSLIKCNCIVLLTKSQAFFFFWKKEKEGKKKILTLTCSLKKTDLSGVGQALPDEAKRIIMSKFIKIVINRKRREFRNIHYLPHIISLYERFSRHLHDDYFLQKQKSAVDAVIDLVERATPFFWVIVDKKTEKFAGFVFLENLVGVVNDFHSAEVTTCFEPEFWGKYTKTCAKKFVNYCFKKYKFKKLKAYVFPQNSKVKMLLKKAGFKKETLLQAETLKQGKLQDIEVYSIIKRFSSKGDASGLVLLEQGDEAKNSECKDARKPSDRESL